MRRLVLACATLLLWAAPATAQMARAQWDCDTGNLFGGTTTYVFNLPGAMVAGNLGVFSVGPEGRTVVSITGTGLTTTINGANQNNSAAGSNNSQWQGIASGTPTAVTVTISGGSAATSYVCFAEFSGAAADQSASTANGASWDADDSDHDSGSVTPPTANNVIVASAWRTGNPAWVEDPDFTCFATGTESYAFCYLLQTAATPQNFVMDPDSTEYSAMRIGAFAGTGAAPAGRPSFLQLLGAE